MKKYSVCKSSKRQLIALLVHWYDERGMAEQLILALMENGIGMKNRPA